MKIQSVHISNYKSIRELEIKNPKSFSVFVGPNGAGKSNIFEALEFIVYSLSTSSTQVISMFKGARSILNYKADFPFIGVFISSEEYPLVGRSINIIAKSNPKDEEDIGDGDLNNPKRGRNLLPAFSRIFLNNSELKKINVSDDRLLLLDGSNLEIVLKRILKDETKREEIVEWLQILVPEFRNIELETSSLSGEVSYVFYEKHSKRPFPKHLISDGTKNILSLLTAVYQSDEPQFLCIEEPENGLHPHVIEHLVSLLRNACKEKGHTIWLNTHSQTLVRQLTADEIIVVEKKKGETTVRQFQGEDMYGMKMDDAWLTNALGGGLP